MEQAGKPSSFPLKTAGLALPFSEQVYLLICLSSINLCVAKAMCTLLKAEPASITWLSKPFPRYHLHLGLSTVLIQNLLQNLFLILTVLQAFALMQRPRVLWVWAMSWPDVLWNTAHGKSWAWEQSTEPTLSAWGPKGGVGGGNWLCCHKLSREK